MMANWNRKENSLNIFWLSGRKLPSFHRKCSSLKEISLVPAIQSRMA